MIHARQDYNRIQDPENKIPKDEPVFLLRGQDKLAPALLLRWASELRLSEGDPEMARMVEDHAQKMIEWQKNVKVKTPDISTNDIPAKQKEVFPDGPILNREDAKRALSLGFRVTHETFSAGDYLYTDGEYIIYSSGSGMRRFERRSSPNSFWEFEMKSHLYDYGFYVLKQ